MDYQIILSPKAVNDLEKIVRYISINNTEAAKRIGERLLNKTKELSQFPLRGQRDSPKIKLDVINLTLKITHNYILAEYVALANARRFNRLKTLTFMSDLLNNPDKVESSKLQK